MTKILIKNGQIVSADDTIERDLLIEGEKIAQVDKDLDVSDAEIIDASGKFILPGGIDPHVHLDLAMFDTVSSDDHYTGSKAAAFGGTTTVMDFVEDKNPDLLQNIADLRAKADPQAAIDYSLHMNITRFDQKVAAQIPSIHESGVTTLKVFMA